MADVQQSDNVAGVVKHRGGEYQIVAGWDLLRELDCYFNVNSTGNPIYMVSDANVFPVYGRLVQQKLEQIGIRTSCYIVEPGEESKSLKVAQDIYSWLANERAERGHMIMAVGGGVIGDLAGFVASTFLRGMPFIQVPTSMAAIVDASVGGKVAVNLPFGKNLVGSFYQPKLVFADLSALKTLPRRALAEGWAEAIKHGLIQDQELFEIFEANPEQLMSLEKDITALVVRKSISIKARIVSEDEHETLGSRVLLNYGHTVGHAIEVVAGYGKYLHGEAVAIGMMVAANISTALSMLDGDIVERQKLLLSKFELPVGNINLPTNQILKAIELDKKTKDGQVKWVLLEGIGKAVVCNEVSKELVATVLDSIS